MKLLAEHRTKIKAIQRLAYDQHPVGKAKSNIPCTCGRTSDGDRPTPACEGLKILLDAYSLALSEGLIS